MPLFSRISRSLQDRVSDNPDGALAKYVWLWQSMGKRPGRRLIPRSIRFFFVASLDLFSLVGWYIRNGILRVIKSAGSKEAIMSFARTNRVAGLTIVAGAVIGGLLTLSPLVLWSPANDVPGPDPVVAPLMTSEARAEAIDRAERILRTRIDEFGVEEPVIQKVGCCRLIVELPGIGLDDESRAKDIIQQSAFLEFKLVIPVTELEGALARIDRQIVGALGVDSIRALGRDTKDPSQDIQNLIFGGDTDQSLNLRPFTSLLASGDVEGAFLVATEDVGIATLFLGLTEVQRVLPRNVSLHWGAEPFGLGQRTYRRLYITEEEAFVTGDMLEDATTVRQDLRFNQAQVNFEFNRVGGRRFSDFTRQHVGDLIAIVLDGEIVSAPVVRARIATRAVVGR